MIPSSQPMPVKGYLVIDRCAEGWGYVYPEDGEIFTGYPCGYWEVHSQSFIEVKRNGQLVRTVNCSDLAEVEFHLQESDEVNNANT